MTKKRWFRFYIDQWFKGTFGLSPNEIAAYVTILCELYDHDGIVELDLDVMARRCGMRPSSFQKALDRLVATRKVSLEAGFLTSKAVGEEIKSREKLGEKSTESRKKRAEKDNEIKRIQAKIPSYKEERIQNSSSSLNVSGSFQPIDIQTVPGQSPALAGMLARQANRLRKH